MGQNKLESCMVRRAARIRVGDIFALDGTTLYISEEGVNSVQEIADEVSAAMARANFKFKVMGIRRFDRADSEGHLTYLDFQMKINGEMMGFAVHAETAIFVSSAKDEIENGCWFDLCDQTGFIPEDLGSN